MKVKFAILTKLARQVEGDYVFFSVLKADKDPQKLLDHYNNSNFPRTEKISGVDCVNEYGVVEDIELELD